MCILLSVYNKHDCFCLQPNDDYHPAPPHESHSLDYRSIVVSTEPSNREDKLTTVSGMIIQQDRHEESNEQQES